MAIFGVLCLVDVLCLLYVCSFLCPDFVYKDTNHAELGSTLMHSTELDHLQRSYFQIRSHFEVLGVRT